MISWIQNHLIRHGRWIFIILLAVIIIAFVFTIGSSPGLTTNRDAYQKRDYYGIDLNSQWEMRDVTDSVSISALLNTGRPVQSNGQLQQGILSRIAMLHLADQLNIPSPGKTVLESYITTKRAFQDTNGKFSNDKYTSFIDNLDANPIIQSNNLINVIGDDYRIDKINDALSGPGYVLPAEALEQTRRNQTTYLLASAEISYLEFNPLIEPSDETLINYFKENELAYQIPERIQAGYIYFPIKKYIDKVVAPSEAELLAHFNSNRKKFVTEYQSNLPTPEDKENVKTDSVTTEPEPSFDDVHKEVETDYIKILAKRIANEAAQNFAYNLYNREIKQNSPNFDGILNELGLAVIDIDPYTKESANTLGISSDMLLAAFNLNENQYYSDAYPIKDGFGVLLYKGRINPEIPNYEAVAKSVKEAYIIEEKRRLFNEKGIDLHESLISEVANGKPFTEVAESHMLSTQTFESFKRTDLPQGITSSILEQAESLKQGAISKMISNDEGGIFIYVMEKTVAEIADDDESLKTNMDNLMRFSSYISSSSLTNELISIGTSDVPPQK